MLEIIKQSVDMLAVRSLARVQGGVAPGDKRSVNRLDDITVLKVKDQFSPVKFVSQLEALKDATTAQQKSALLAAASELPTRLAVTAATAKLYPYLGRTDDYKDWNVIDPGLKIVKIETFTRDSFGIVRLTTDNGKQAYGQLSTSEPPSNVVSQTIRDV